MRRAFLSHTNLVTLENVSKQYSERQLLDRVNLLVNEGDRIGVIGPNGAGESTFPDILAGYLSEDMRSSILSNRKPR